MNGNSWTRVGTICGTAAGIATGIGLLVVAIMKTENDKIERTQKVVSEYLTQGKISFRDVNGDGLDDLVVGYQVEGAKPSEMIFYKTEKGYMTAEQIKKEGLENLNNKYSVKVAAEAPERK